MSLRFPRITRVRVGADSKPLSEIESEHSLWKIYQEILDSRSNSFVPSSSIQLGSPLQTTKPRAERRFLTEVEYVESKKKKTKRSTKKEMNVIVPQVETKTSRALEGLTFAILGSRFRVKEGSIDYDEASAEGWLSEATNIRRLADLVKYIKGHGGTYKINPDASCSFVLGGSTNDVQVVTFMKAIEDAIQRTQGKSRAVTKRDERDFQMAKSPGILRWTFPIALVHHWSQNSMTKPIKEEAPSILLVNPLDFLARPKESLFDQNLMEMDFSSVTQVRRALEVVSRSNNDEDAVAQKDWKMVCHNWQDDEKWIASCGWEPFWPYAHHQPPKPKVVVYPDIFADCGCLEREGERETPVLDASIGVVEAVLPLIKVMGGTIASHLGPTVTHVVTSLCVGVKSIRMDSAEIKPDAFCDETRGQLLLTRLYQIKNTCGFEHDESVVLLAPEWVRQQFPNFPQSMGI